MVQLSVWEAEEAGSSVQILCLGATTTGWSSWASVEAGEAGSSVQILVYVPLLRGGSAERQGGGGGRFISSNPLFRCHYYGVVQLSVWEAGEAGSSV